MIAQMTHRPQISHAYRELLSHESGNEIFIRDSPASLVGKKFWAWAEALPEAVLIGVTRLIDGRCQPFLNPPSDFLFAAGDKLVFIARDWVHGCQARELAQPSWPKPSRNLDHQQHDELRILIFGWSRRVPALLSELEAYAHQKHRVTIVSRVPLADRARRMAHYGFNPEQTVVEQIDADYTIPDTMKALDPAGFDLVICLASDMTESDEEADARSLVAHAILKDIVSGETEKPRALVELLDELNVVLLESTDCEYLLPKKKS